MAQSIVDDIELTLANSAKIKVFGVGGGGGNAVQHMIASGLRGVQFICANTDVQALNKSSASIKLQLGEKLTKGLGAGANPAVGRDAAIESSHAIKDAIGDADMVFVTAGLGGGTGTGAAPVVAQLAKEMGVLTVGVVTRPFAFEGTPRKRSAEDGLGEIKQHVDCLITIPNDRLLVFAPKKAKMNEMLQKANEVLYYAVKGIADVIVGDGMINLDFADVRTTMAESGLALMGTGMASGENRAREATHRAIISPLLEDVSLESAKAVLYNVSASSDITADEVKEIGELIADAAPKDANIIFGIIFDENMGDEIRITVIATGNESPKPVPVTPPVRGGGRGIRIHFPHDEETSGAGKGRRGEQWGDEQGYPPIPGPHPPRIRDISRWTGGHQGRERIRPGEEYSVYDADNSEWDVPAFLKSQAD